MRKQSLQQAFVLSGQGFDRRRKTAAPVLMENIIIEEMKPKIILTRQQVRNLMPGQVTNEDLVSHNRYKLKKINKEYNELVENLRKLQSDEKIVDPKEKQVELQSPKVSKKYVLNKMETHFRRVDPDFRINNYLSENDSLIQKQRLKLVAKKPSNTFVKSSIESLSRQIKTPLLIGKRKQNYTSISQNNNNITTVQEIDILNETNISVDRKTKWELRKRGWNMLSQDFDVLLEGQEGVINPEENLIDEEEFNKIQSQHQKQRTIDKLDKSPLRFLFWKFKRIIQENYEHSSDEMKTLIDFYTPVKKSSKSNTQTVSMRKSRVHSSTIKSPQRQFFSNNLKVHTSAEQTKCMEYINERLTKKVQQIKNSLKWEKKKLDKNARTNQYKKLMNNLERGSDYNQSDMNDFINVKSYIQDKSQLKEVLITINPADTSLLETLDADWSRQKKKKS